jgi:hypothetical protein
MPGSMRRSGRREGNRTAHIVTSPPLPPRSGGEGSGVGGVSANSLPEEHADRPPTPNPSPPRARARGGRGDHRNRHCEEHSCPPKPAFGRRRMRRSNPFLHLLCRTMDCFASLAMTMMDMTSRSRDSIRPRFEKNSLPSKSEGAGNAGCALHPRSRVQNGEGTHTSKQVQRRHSDIPCAMALRLISCSPRRSGLFDTVASRIWFCPPGWACKTSARLDANH